MKTFFTGSLLFLLCTTLCSESAQALTFADSVSFSSGSDPFVNISYSASQTSGFGWTHDLSEVLSGHDRSSITFLDAVLTVVYSRTNLDELWQVEGLGNLASSFNEMTNTFILTSPQIQDLQDGLFSLKLKELTTGADSMRMHSVLLRGNFQMNKATAGASIPEPGTFLLMFLGALGFAYAERIK